MRDGPKKNLHIPVPMTGRPTRKTIYNWTTRQYEEVVAIELGVRVDPPSLSADQVRERNGRPSRGGEVNPDLLGTHSPNPTTKAGRRRAKIIAYLFRHETGTAQEIADHAQISADYVRQLCNTDPLIEGMVSKPSNLDPQRYRLRAEARQFGPFRF